MVIGIDVGKDRVDAVELIDDEIRDHMTRDYAKQRLTRPQSLLTLRTELMHWLQDKTPSGIYVEGTPAMRSSAVTIALAETVGMICSLPYQVHKVNVMEWKALLDKGNIDKGRVREILTGRYPETEMFGGRQDLFDALGVALYGVQHQRLLADGLGGGLA